mmetsp:Transcript_7149/g.14705  ORF Transcript_7149/g.14705 Transcript_7149/m.14705 type:complete len:83 (-) Transcript_7149:718-966(-)
MRSFQSGVGSYHALMVCGGSQNEDGVGKVKEEHLGLIDGTRDCDFVPANCRARYCMRKGSSQLLQTRRSMPRFHAPLYTAET